MVGGTGVSGGIAPVADVPGVGPRCATPPRAAPHATVKTNRPALTRSATFDLPIFVITVNSKHRTSEAQRIGDAPKLAELDATGENAQPRGRPNTRWAMMLR